MRGRLISADQLRRAAVHWAHWAGATAVFLTLSSSVARAQTASSIADNAITTEVLSERLAPELRAELDSYISDALVAFNVPGEPAVGAADFFLRGRDMSTIKAEP